MKTRRVRISPWYAPMTTADRFSRRLSHHIITQGQANKGKHTRRNHARAHTSPTTGTTRARATRAYVLTCIHMTHTTGNNTQMHT